MPRGAQGGRRQPPQAQGKRVELERPMREAWLCPRCNRTTRDARHVCQHCLAPEPSYYTAATALDHTPGDDDDDEPRSVTKHLPSTSADPGVRLISVDTTQRVYRIYTEPIQVQQVERGGSRGKKQEVHVDAAGHVSSHGDTSRSEEDSDSDAKGVAEAAAVGVDEGEGGAAVAMPPVRTMTLEQMVSATRAYNDKASESEASRPSAPRKSPYTHFLALTIGKLPAAEASARGLLNALRAFAGGRDAHRSRLVPRHVQDPARLHLTLLLLTLENEAAVQLAKTLLHDKFLPAWEQLRAKAQAASQAGTGNSDEKQQVQDLSPVISLGGLHVMPPGHRSRPDVRHARVVYMGLCDAHSQHLVRTLQDTLQSAFAELITDFAEAERSKRTPHMTLLNEKWRHEDEAAGSSTRGPQTFDASLLLERFAHVAYIGAGESGREPLTLSCVELCRRGAHDPVTQGYIVEDSVPL